MLPSVIDCPDATFLELTTPLPVKLMLSPLTKLLNVAVKLAVFASIVPSYTREPSKVTSLFVTSKVPEVNS